MGLLSNIEKGLENCIEGIFKNKQKKPRKKSPKEIHSTKLVVIAGPHRGETFYLKEGKTIIGRAADSCDHKIVLKDSSVSRRHAQVEYSGGKVSINDLGSTNGVYVNSRKTIRKTLEPGDIISLGRTVFVFEVE